MNHIEAVIARLQRKKASDSRRLRLFTSGRCWREYSHIHRGCIRASSGLM